MSVATQNAPQGTRETYRQDDGDFARLISRDARIGGLYQRLSGCEGKIENVLPDFMKGQAKRLIARALMTFKAKEKDLGEIPDEVFQRLVIEAAELGFAIDGKLCYVVKYKTTFQLQLDYKAVVAVAKRNRTIVDIDADIVCENDHFVHGKYGEKTVLEHTYDLTKPRGRVTGAYCRVFLPGGQWNYGIMNRAELDKIQSMSKAKYDGRPWDSWEGEMQKKTVIRRTLKLYQDDPGLMRMLEVTGWQDDEDDAPPAKPQTVDELRQMITASLQKPQACPPEAESLPHEPESHDHPTYADDVDADLVERFRATLAGCKDADAIEAAIQATQALGDVSEATWKAIDGAVATRRAELSPAPKGKKQGSLVQ
jgi:phage RecT family recombinase